MSYMFEVYYHPPSNPKKEADITARVVQLGGHLSFREDAEVANDGSVCLTYEFDELSRAEQAAADLRKLGEYVEGPVEYAD
jgi:hypothetical protein